MIHLFSPPLVGDLELCGIDVCGAETLVITNSEQSFNWYGLTLLISEGTLPEGLDKCIVSIKASLAGQYRFPEDTYPVSAVFLVHCEPKCKFAKTITMEIDHCATSVNTPKLSFVRAQRTPETLPYIFKKIGGGQFNEDIGTIELSGFCLVGAVQDESTTKDQSCQREYNASVFHFTDEGNVNNHCLKIDFVLTWNTKAHRAVSVYIYNICIAY